MAKKTKTGDQSSEPKQSKPRATKAKLELVKDDAQEAEQPAPFNPEISMRWEGDTGPEWQGTLDALVRMNELDPMQDAEFIEEMRAALREHGEYRGGGGASPIYVLTVGASDPAPTAANPTKPKGGNRARRQEHASAEQAAAPRAPKRRGGKQASPKDRATTLAELSEKFLARLEADGRSGATVGAYRSDLAIAQRVLGADKPIDSILPADVIAFNASDTVVLSKTGAAKAGPTVERTRRVLRLALDYAEYEGWIKVSPCGCEPAEIEA